jgi:phytanoyl-CoA hydroxylase
MTLTAAEIEQFDTDGYVVKEGVFTASDLQPLIDGLTGVISRTTERLVAEGKLDKAFEEEPFERRLAAILEHNSEAGDEVARAIKGQAGGGYKEQSMLDSLRHKSLVDCVAQLVGPNIVGSSVYRVRPKVPNHESGEVPWHQDSGYFMPHCDSKLIVTCWIPLVDATLENGCVYVLPKRHQDGILRHYTGGRAGLLEIVAEDLPEEIPVPLEMAAGSVLFMTNLTPHASFENKTDQVRWSIDLRYHSFDVPNNVDEDPASYTPERDPVTMACYPPEADFVIRDTKDPAREVKDIDTFQALRQRYELSRPMGPRRGWTPLNERSI